jgi:hypothetical protein
MNCLAGKMRLDPSPVKKIFFRWAMAFSASGARLKSKRSIMPAVSIISRLSANCA